MNGMTKTIPTRKKKKDKPKSKAKSDDKPKSKAKPASRPTRTQSRSKTGRRSRKT